MNKVIKQVITILLTIITVALVFAIIFYKYIPTNKVIPTKVPAYSTPERVEAEINETNTETEFTSQNQVYEITDSDLSLYQSKKSYNPGKSDPFKAYSEGSTETNSTGESQDSSGTTTGNSKNEGNEKTLENQNVTDNYYKSAGIGTGSK